MAIYSCEGSVTSLICSSVRGVRPLAVYCLISKLSTNMLIRIVGIQMHAYKDRLEELRQVAPGTVVFLTREDNGPVRRHSIRAMLGNECLGYVKRLEINKVRDIMGRRSALQARILSLCDDELAFCAEIDGESTVAPIEINHELDGWTPLGPILEPTNLELNLQAWINILSAMSETPGDWTPENEAQLQLVMDNAWIDMSGETHLQLAEIIGLLMAAPEESKQAAGLKLDRTFSRYGRDEYRQRRFEYLRELSQSEQMARILCNNTESIMDWMTDVPDPYEKEFYSDPLTLMRLLWYADLPKDKLQALLTRVCMKIAAQSAEINARSKRTNENETLRNENENQKGRKSRAAALFADAENPKKENLIVREHQKLILQTYFKRRHNLHLDHLDASMKRQENIVVCAFVRSWLAEGMVPENVGSPAIRRFLEECGAQFGAVPRTYDNMLRRMLDRDDAVPMELYRDILDLVRS